MFQNIYLKILELSKQPRSNLQQTFLISGGKKILILYQMTHFIMRQFLANKNCGLRADRDS